MQQQRREFLSTLLGAATAQVLAGQTRSGDMIYRTLGKTGERVSAIGLGGSHIGRAQDEQEGIRIIRTGIDRGITFLDNCWDYANGKCEVWMGNALRDGYRQKIFLMTKFDGRTKAATAKQIDESLQRLQTDVVDLMQYHENIRMRIPTGSSLRADRWKLFWRRRRRARSGISGSRAIRIRRCTCACW